MADSAPRSNAVDSVTALAPALSRILGSRKGTYLAVVVVLSLPIVATLTYLAGTGKMSWAVWSERVQWLFALIAGLAAAAVAGTAVEDMASKGAASSVQVQGDNATVNVPSVRPPPALDTPKVSILPTAPFSELGDPKTEPPLKKDG